MFEIAFCFFGNKNDHDHAFQRLATTRSAAPAGTPPVASPFNVPVMNCSREKAKERRLPKKAFKDSRKMTNLPGILLKLCKDYISTYEEACTDYNFSREQSFQYPHSVFDDKAKIFYQENVYLGSSFYVEACRLRFSKYSHIDRQICVR